MTSLSSATALPGATLPALSSAEISTNPASIATSSEPSSQASPSSVIVTIPSSLGVNSIPLYTQQGTIAGSEPAATSRAISAQSVASQLNSLGTALLDRFKTTGDNDSQSTSLTSTSVGNQFGAAPSGPQGNVTFTVKTASGVEVDIMVSSQDGTLSENVRSSGTLSSAEQAGLAKMSDAFQKALTGLSAVPPAIDFSGLIQANSSAFSSISLQYNVIGNGANNVSAKFSSSSAERSLSVTSAAGSLSVNVDTSNSALGGSDAQRQQAIASYVKQIDAASAQGHGNAQLASMFADTFTQMNSSYGTSSQQLPGTGYAPWLDQADHAMMTGLADFSASMSDTPVSPNPMRVDETDSMSYQISQSTSSEGSLLKGSVSQHQQSHLNASYHETLSGTGSLHLTTSLQSQSYTYTQVSVDTDTTASAFTEKGTLLNASLNQTTSQSTRQREYEKGDLVSDVTTPKSVSQSHDLLALLKPLLDNDDAAKGTSSWQQALSEIHGMVLQTIPSH